MNTPGKIVSGTLIIGSSILLFHEWSIGQSIAAEALLLALGIMWFTQQFRTKKSKKG